MAELKAKVNDQSVEKFLNGIADDQTRQDCFTILEMMKQATNTEPKMWGSSILWQCDFGLRPQGKTIIKESRACLAKRFKEFRLGAFSENFM